MTLTPDHTIGRLLRPAATVVVGLLVLAGCGSSGDGEDSANTGDDLSTTTLVAPGDDAEPTTDPQTDEGTGTDVVPPQRILPTESEVVDGFVEVPAECLDPDQYAAGLSFAVPEGWEATGISRGGSGSPLNDSAELTFTTADGRVWVDLSPDSVQPDGTITVNGEPFTSFDYEYESYSSSGEEDSGEITFESLGEVPVGDQDVEVWFADQAQDTDFLSYTEYKARVRTADLTNPAVGDADGVILASMVVTVVHDAEETDISLDEVAGIIAGLAIPDCTWDHEVAMLEIALNMDLNNDGEIATPQDILDF